MCRTDLLYNRFKSFRHQLFLSCLIIPGTFRDNEGGPRIISDEGSKPAEDEDSRLRTWTSAARSSMNSAHYGNVSALMLIRTVSQIPD